MCDLVLRSLHTDANGKLWWGDAWHPADLDESGELLPKTVWRVQVRAQKTLTEADRALDEKIEELRGRA